MDNVIAFINPKSGGQLGEAVFEQLKKHLRLLYMSLRVFNISTKCEK